MHFKIGISLYVLHSMHFTLCISLYAFHSMKRAILRRVIIIIKVFIIAVLKSALITSMVDYNNRKGSDISHDEKGLSYYAGFWHINR